MTDDDTASTSAHTILLVEDDEDVGDFIRQVLHDELPHAVLHVPDAIRALEAVNSIKPSLFILDYHLPGIDGLELSDRLHAREGLETVPTLMMSASPPARQSMRERRISFLAKPFDLAELIQTIEKLLPEQQT